MSRHERHVTPEQLASMSRRGLVGGHFLHLLAHLRHLCEECGLAVSAYFARLDDADPGAELLRPLPQGLDPSCPDPSGALRRAVGQRAAQLLVRQSEPQRQAWLASGLAAHGFHLLSPWMALTSEALGREDGEGERRARLALQLAQCLDGAGFPAILLVDYQVDAWVALAQDALIRGETAKAASRLRASRLLVDGGSGDALQAGYLLMLEGLLLSQQGDPKAGVRRLARAAELGRELVDPKLAGGALLLQGLLLEKLGHREAAAAALEEGSQYVEKDEAPELVQSAAETLAALSESGSPEAETSGGEEGRQESSRTKEPDTVH